MIRVGIVGHRFLKQAEAEFAASQCMAVLKDLLKEHESIVACSAIAAGADTIFATAALKLHIPLEIVLPFDEYGLDFEEEKALQTFLRLKAAASKITRLPYGPRSDEAYRAAMQWILATSNIVLAAWNGLAQGGPGGTAKRGQQYRPRWA